MTKDYDAFYLVQLKSDASLVPPIELKIIPYGRFFAKLVNDNYSHVFFKTEQDELIIIPNNWVDWMLPIEKNFFDREEN
jgi:hypothetical protein